MTSAGRAGSAQSVRRLSSQQVNSRSMRIAPPARPSSARVRATRRSSHDTPVPTSGTSRGGYTILSGGRIGEVRAAHAGLDVAPAVVLPLDLRLGLRGV